MEIIDAHAHIYPEKIAAKATDTIGVFYDIKMKMPAGTAERLIQEGQKAGRRCCLSMLAHNMPCQPPRILCTGIRLC